MKGLNLLLKLIVGFGTAYLFANALIRMELSKFLLIPFIVFFGYAVVRLEERTMIIIRKKKEMQHYTQPEWKQKMPVLEKYILEWVLFILGWVGIAMIWALGHEIFVK